MDEIISQAKALDNPGSTAVVAKREGDAWRSLERSRSDCLYMLDRTTPERFAQEAIDKLYATPGNARLEKPGCQLAACVQEKTAINVCWDPVGGAPDVYEKPWSYVADYATGIVEEWCGRSRPSSMALSYWVGGKVWDPMGLGVEVRRVEDHC